MELTDNTTIGPYQVVRLLSKNRLAAVYQARQVELDRDVALKVIAPEVVSQPGFAERFRQSARAAAQLHHPNIVPLYDFRCDGVVCYLASELIPGPTLAQHLQQARESGERLPLSEAARVARAIGAALDLAHRRGAVHGRLSPANIMFTAEGEPVLADFGLPNLAEGLTLADWLQPLVAPIYLAPEQGRGQPATPSSDLYSLGVILYEMVTGRVPFAAPSPLDLVVKHMSEAPAAPQTLVSVPGALGAVLLKALAKAPEERYPSGAALALAFEEGLSGATSSLAGTPQVPKPAPAEGPQMPETGLTATLGSFLAAVRGESGPKPGGRRGWLAQVLALLGAGLALTQYLLQVFDLVNRPLAPIMRALPGVIIVFFLVAGVASVLALVRPTPRPQKRIAAVALGLIVLASVSWGGWRYYNAIKPPKAVIIVVAEFQGQKATKGVDWGRRIYTRVKEEISRLKLDEQVEVRRVFESYESSEQARKAGEAQKATLVLWGWYDDLAVSPHFEVLRSARPFQERLIAQPVDLVDFDLYARQGPQDMAYIVDVVLGLVRYAANDYTGAVALFTSALEAAAQAPTVQGQEAAYLYRGIVGLDAHVPMDSIIADLQEAARLKPDMYQAHWALAIAYTGYCTPTLALDAALAEAQEVVRLRPQDSMAYWLLGQVHAVRKEWGEAEEAFREGTRLDPQNAEAYVGLGETLEQQGRKEEAQAAREKGLEIRQQQGSPKSKDPALVQDDLGRAYFAAGQYDRALAAYKEAARLRPDNAQYHRHVGDAYYWQGKASEDAPSTQLNEAIAAYEQAIALDPHDYLALTKLGICYTEAGRQEDALKTYEEAMRVMPCDSDGLVLLATQYEDMGRMEEAEAAFRRLTDLAPSMSLGWQYLATMAFSREDFVSAEANYRAAVQADPDDPTLHYGLASSLYALGRYEECAAEYRRVIELAPNDAYYAASAYAGLGDALARMGLNTEAIDAYQRAIALDPDQALTWVSLGMVYEADKDWVAAEEAYARAVELEPKEAYVVGAHARALYQLGRLAEAVAEYEQAAKLAPQDVSYLEQIALGYAALERADKAETAAQAALALNPQSVLAHLVLGWVAEDRGDKVKAKQEYELALQYASGNATLQKLAEDGLARVGG